MEHPLHFEKPCASLWLNSRFLTAMLLFLGCSIFLRSLPVHAKNSLSPEVEKWQQKVQVNPNDGLAQFNLGVAYHRAKQWRLAVAAYDQTIQLKSSLAPVAIYYKALIYKQVGKIEVAKKIISQLNLADVPENLKQQVLLFKNKLYVQTMVEELSGSSATPPPQATQSEKWLSLSLDLSAGQNSNPATVADTSATGAGSDTQTAIRFSASSLLAASKTSDFQLLYSFAGTFLNQDGGYNYSFNQLSLPFSWYQSSTRFKLSPEFYIDNYGNQSYSQAPGGTIEVAIRVDDNYWGLSYHAATVTNLTSTYSYLSGSQGRIVAYYDMRWPSEKLYFGVTANKYTYQDTTSLSSSYSSYPVTVAYTAYFNQFDLTASIGEETRIYPKAANDSFARQDNRFFGTFHLGVNVATRMQLYFEASTSQNQSNFDGISTTSNDSYYQNVISVGVSAYY